MPDRNPSATQYLAKMNAEAASGGHRDIRNLIPLHILKTLSQLDLIVISLKVAGMGVIEIRKRLRIRAATLTQILNKESVQQAIAEVTMKIAGGILTARDVAEVAETEIMERFYRIATDPDTPLDMCFKFGKAILDYRMELVKAIPNPIMVNHEDASRIISIKENMLLRMNEHLSSSEGIQDAEETPKTEGNE